jgi:hypothetical protein
VSSSLNKEWYIFRDGRGYGPITEGTLHDLVQEGQVKQDDYVWCTDFIEWVRFGSLTFPTSPTLLPGRFQFFRTLKRLLSRHVFAERLSLFKKIRQIISRPSDFADKFIKDDKPNALFDSVKFYMKTFALTFAILAIADQFRFSESVSEVRALVIRLLPQVALGTLVSFLLLRITCNRVTIAGVLQTVLYVDAVYLLFDALLTIPTWYLNYSLHVPTDGREVDLFTTEFENCLSTQSFAFWLIRGDLQFFMYDDKWHSWVQFFIDNRHYITVLPFLFLFAHMVRKKYGTNFFVAAFAAGIAFASATEGFDLVESKARAAIASNTNCEGKYVQSLLSKYSAERIAKQLEFKLGSALKHNFPNVTQTFWVEGNEYVIALKAGDHVANITQLSGIASQFFRSAYCGPHPYWIAVRGMKYSLAAFVFHQGRTIVSLRLKPDDCRTV